MANFSDMSLQRFSLWSEAALRSFLTLRKKSTEGRFDELAARAFIAWEENIPVNAAAEHESRKLLDEYKLKLTCNVGPGSTSFILPDPLSLTDGWLSEKEGVKLWPPVYLTDISEYLRLTSPKELVQSVLNEYKIGKAYRYFSCGWIKEVLYHPVREKSPVCLLKARVTPSMNLSSPSYFVWVSVEKPSSSVAGGKILSAYCNCTAGMQGSCNHIASLLFKMEHTTLTGRHIQGQSSTSMPCRWNIPKVKSTPVPVDSVSWRKDNFSKRKAVDHLKTSKRSFLPCSNKQYVAIQDMAGLRKKLCSIASECAPEARFKLLTLGEKYKATTATSHVCPPTIIKYAENHKNVDIHTFINELKFSQTMCDALRDATVDQHNCQIWKEQRKGRITASIFQRVQSRAKTLQIHPSEDPSKLVAHIMGYSKTVTTQAMKHGISCEPHAKRVYRDMMKKSHKHFSARNCGIEVLPDKPYISASIDLGIDCECCGKGICEIKCPSTVKSLVPSVENVAYLENVDGTVCLKKTHA